ncbi:MULTISPECIES: bifunctional 4-hydroxy-2-oxoglutarate aldolase/2-dehydro-3-deoxy-phosphogluconate aldolase [unclassified Neisseria]|uniref:bifunctional 4-hydroxy-2-oxoglutarate aldolase/2-dehydro-3-deoxy-phosphogluconate aldolase n=1 Tax=unclassified Neisseria TaxID=2623750 RepID=UPI0026660F65|nr:MULTISPECIES: bifunctional 4-hydroxy-2-oxoglutarate aldolase/2-dehydro-3-deoxy-phosphogluconate aldolase [unclassified Neisseria]MDO1510509.1 bifunctional 4-hydroxy-2-oxoglutarate aldolase/2-dehydro-3-deoxy-phosphogluconate aldolase [Neisseria sp. MVDL19-042950]MDO1516678.1 bifunctional 4-hydroxy-2-oxoglutarate aldolase/2-dehydro-3-deoxy-phosphogluconate aldolase [Neisseria sp. MVDL18-041461]MDO1563825.1 bifunctional 4-hydroxy-2-oxoglutarate aldolase/2-dehydro-3-deoxy-phosphogluconate aldolas
MNPRDILTAGAVVPVMAIDDISTAVDLAHALVEGGIPTLEITLRTPAGIEAIRLIKKEVPNAIVGAGTVINGEQLKAVEDAGAVFAISPGFNINFAKAAQQSSIAVIPGIATPGELMLALEHGIDTMKLFPAEVVDGKNMLKALYGPFPQVKFCPTGGISLETAPDYLKLPNVLCVGGSWLTPKDAVQNKDWATITLLAKEAAALK